MNEDNFSVTAQMVQDPDEATTIVSKAAHPLWEADWKDLRTYAQDAMKWLETAIKFAENQESLPATCLLLRCGRGNTLNH
jgi:hypothetical protein